MLNIMADSGNFDIDTSIIATSLYTIALEFNSLANSFWAILSYTLSFLGTHVLLMPGSSAKFGKVVLSFSLGAVILLVEEPLLLQHTLSSLFSRWRADSPKASIN